MDAEELKQDIRKGRIDSDRLIDVVVAAQQKLQARIEILEKRITELENRNVKLEKENAELQKQLGRSPTTKLDEPFSLRAEEQRQEARGKNKRKSKQKGRRGRLNTQDKIAQAERTEPVFPEGVPPDACKLSHVRPVWRLEKGRAVLVAYQIYRGPNHQYGKIPGVLGRSEFGLEIVTEIAYLVYILGLSFDKVCLLLNFFQNVNLKKGQADALLYQLSRHWEHEFEVLCTLLANSLVVHADETSWSLNSVWAFLSEKARVLLFGVHKDADTLKKILDPETFGGLVISDDAAVYADFTEGQKCWAHLLRKAIKLTLQDPSNAEYRHFTDRLLEIYYQARRLQGDQRFSDAGRDRAVAGLDDAIHELCAPQWDLELPPQEGIANDYRLLVNEIMRLMIDQQLFAFVTAKPVEQIDGTTKPVDGTNNQAERTLRGPAQARATGRTNKAMKGARRQTIVTSVLESLRLYLPTFTLSSVLAEMKRWCAIGRSCFAELLDKLKFALPEATVLGRLFPSPSG